VVELDPSSGVPNATFNSPQAHFGYISAFPGGAVSYGSGFWPICRDLLEPEVGDLTVLQVDTQSSQSSPSWKLPFVYPICCDDQIPPSAAVDASTGDIYFVGQFNANTTTAPAGQRQTGVARMSTSSPFTVEPVARYLEPTRITERTGSRSVFSPKSAAVYVSTKPLLSFSAQSALSRSFSRVSVQTGGGGSRGPTTTFGSSESSELLLADWWWTSAAGIKGLTTNVTFNTHYTWQLQTFDESSQAFVPTSAVELTGDVPASVEWFYQSGTLIDSQQTLVLLFRRVTPGGTGPQQQLLSVDVQTGACTKMPTPTMSLVTLSGL